jgi:hypothetical protein
MTAHPWTQNVVAIGLLKVIKGRWACLPLSQRYYFCKDDISRNQPTFKGKEIAFQNKHQQAVEMLAAFAGEFPRQRILVVADSWFGNQGLWKPLRKELGTQAQLLSRLRVDRRDHRILRRQMEDRSRLQRTSNRISAVPRPRIETR